MPSTTSSARADLPANGAGAVSGGNHPRPGLAAWFRTGAAGERGQAITVLLMSVSMAMLAVTMMYNVPVSIAADEAARLQQAADAAAVAGAQAIVSDLPELLPSMLADGDLPGCGTGTTAASDYALRNEAGLVGYCYYPSSDEIRVTVRSRAVTETGERETADAIAETGLRLTSCRPSFSLGRATTPTEGDEESPSVTVRGHYRCGDLVVPVTVTDSNVVIDISAAEIHQRFNPALGE